MTEDIINEENVNNDLQESLQNQDTYIENVQNDEAEEGVDYSIIAREDILSLKSEFPELSAISDITGLDDPLRYAALRDLGLSPAEAYLATQGKRRARDNRSHLVASPTIASASKGAISEREMEAARDIFPGISDSEIRKLYRKVTSNERKNYV